MGNPTAFLISAVLVVAGCSKGPAMQLEPKPMDPAYEDTAAERPRIRYGDGRTSLNDRCMVRQNKLNLRMPAIYVNGDPVGFC